VWLRLAIAVGLAGAVGALTMLVDAPSESAAAPPSGDDALQQSNTPAPGEETARPARLAITCVEQATIREHPSVSSPAACLVPEGTQLLIRDAPGPWYRVRMGQGPTCYVARGDVRLTGVHVTEGVPAPDAEGRPDVVAEARRHLGIRYRWGGKTWRGMDCSGFVQTVFGAFGTKLPRSAAQQARVGMVVITAELQPGDRVYFGPRGGSIDHTGIYIGDGSFIHASSRHGRVVISCLDDPHYVRRYAFARR
jgi:cell wall-associated NlpC family hydrolase